MRVGALVLALVVMGTLPANANENPATEPGMPWPVVTEDEARELRAAARALQADTLANVTEPGMPWPVVSEAEALALKDASRSVTEPGMPWPVAYDTAGDATQVAAVEASPDAMGSVTEPGMPWPVVGEVIKPAPSDQDMTAAAEPERAVTEPGMPWPVVAETTVEKPVAASTSSDADVAACEVGIKNALASGSIEFRSAKATVKRQSNATLAAIAAVAKTCTGVRLIVAGHTDSVGDADFNQLLSRKRAGAVADYLVNAGFDRRFVVTEGYGSSRPLAPNDTAAGRSKNRRIEISVVALSDATQ